MKNKNRKSSFLSFYLKTNLFLLSLKCLNYNFQNSKMIFLTLKKIIWKLSVDIFMGSVSGMGDQEGGYLKDIESSWSEMETSWTIDGMDDVDTLTLTSMGYFLLIRYGVGPKRPHPSICLVVKNFKFFWHTLKYHINIGLHRKNHTPEVKDKNFMSIWKFDVKIEEFLKCQLFSAFTMQTFWQRNFEHL